MTDTWIPVESVPAESVESAAVPQQRRIVTAVPGPRSQELQARRTAVVSAGVSSVLPVYIERAHGAVLEDVDGNRFLDFGAGIGVTTVGHTPARVVEAATAQSRDVLHTLFTITPYEEYVRVAELLAAHTPGDFAKKSVLVNSGAEAVENGVKIARKHTGRRAVAVLDHAYHGRTNLTMAMNHKAMPYGTGFGPFAGDVYHAPSSYPYRDGLSGAEAAARTIGYLDKVVGASDLACLVVEPIQGEGGFMVYADGYLPALQEWCTANGVVMIADEIQSGMARTGAYYASEHFGWTPDLVLTAKGIAAGFPLAAVTGRAEIMDASHPGGLGGTFGGNPVACAAAIAVFDTIEEEGLLAEARRIEATLTAGLERLRERYDVIGDIRGRGAMIAIELVESGTAEIAKTPNAAAVSAIVAYAAQQGVLFLSAGTWGNVLRFLPSLRMTDELIEDALGVLDDAFASLA
ncbi:aspartate aminotransferase family protein [Agromyces luteolus]|uniref:(S)-3-amino-2-methylpropionate transaminase n=1 Tax=Agromyces luteolus TaxID=88373 RepID=A0A7C9LY17_9MICO|nr:4-aminobutyrate--2-oxoglutarate transaminase [Agromyces luteolus]MUN06493.1 4-aminobutyrate--2-oxoglutarate transaminase [Agromyces luteolus]GLK28928.1 aspartate aminotransferase family protein [Agromyces luteolus]